VPQLLSRNSSASLFDQLALLWDSLCVEHEAATEDLAHCTREAKASGGRNAIANERLASAELRCKEVRRDMLKFLDQLELGGE